MNISVRYRKKVAGWVLSLLMLAGPFSAASASSSVCFLDMSGAVATFGFDGITSTLFISNIRFSNRAFNYSWKLNLNDGSWELIGAGGAASGSGGLIDFSTARVEFTSCVDMVIRGFRFVGQSFSACWRLDTYTGDWAFGSLGVTCPDGGQGSTQTSRVTVRVLDASGLFNPPISGATVIMRPSSGSPFTGTTDAHGVVEFSSVPYGTYTLEVSAEGYANSSSSLTVSSPTESFRVTLQAIPVTGQYRIVLSWGDSPPDLDAHLLVPPDLTHLDGYSLGWQGYIGVPEINRGAQDNYPWATMDRDDTDGFGPETITIHRLIDGRYRYFVHLWIDRINPSDVNISTTPLTGSQATVTLYRGNTQIRSWSVPTRGTGRYWHVFDLDGSTATVTDFNLIQSTAPSAF
jgi:hypothetical protein